jgi:hypothetical protein
LNLSEVAGGYRLGGAEGLDGERPAAVIGARIQGAPSGA